MEYEGDEHDFSDADRDSVLIIDNKIFEHSVLRVNYTTYDLRREQDSINPCTHADLMVLSHEEERTHPYWYARLIKVFHVGVRFREQLDVTWSQPERMNILFVRWFKRDSTPAGFAAKRLQRLQFFEDDCPDAYGFLDPECVIRGIHLIPAFAFGRTKQSHTKPTFARRKEEKNTDSCFYYLNMCVEYRSRSLTTNKIYVPGSLIGICL